MFVLGCQMLHFCRKKEKMKKYIVVILALMSISPAWAKRAKHKKKSVSTIGIQAVTLHHSACFGRCPEYSIEITPTGKVTYTGIRFVSDSGTFVKKVPSEKTYSIVKMLSDNKVDTCRLLYQSRAQDLPGIFYTITYKDSVKRILNANFGPVYLLEAARSIDSLGKKNNDGWKKK